MKFKLGDRVSIIADPSRNGRHVGCAGRISSNTLDGFVWVFLGLHYANFHEDQLERDASMLFRSGGANYRDRKDGPVCYAPEGLILAEKEQP